MAKTLREKLCSKHQNGQGLFGEGEACTIVVQKRNGSERKNTAWPLTGEGYGRIYSNDGGLKLDCTLWSTV
jgi:hypothetical protein